MTRSRAASGEVIAEQQAMQVDDYLTQSRYRDAALGSIAAFLEEARRGEVRHAQGYAQGRQRTPSQRPPEPSQLGCRRFRGTLAS